MTNSKKVEEFMEKYGQEIPNTPGFPSSVTVSLRIRLIKEELDEFIEACRERDIVEVADALCDILYVAYGAALSFGIPVEECFAEVHRNNMQKLDGKRDEFGKVIKTQDHPKPNLKGVMAKYMMTRSRNEDVNG